MSIQQKKQNGILVVTLEGSLLGSPEVMELNGIFQKIGKEKQTHVIVDFGKVSLINSSALTQLIQGVAILKNAGGKLKLASLSSKVKELLERTRTAAMFEMYDSVQEAKESF